MFDLLLVTLMVSETWLITGVLLVMGEEDSSSMGGLSILRIFRLVKILRMARLARLMSSFPELVVLLKGIKVALRTVTFFFLLWAIIIYIYAVVFKQITHGSAHGWKYFETVPQAMNTLLLNGLLPDFTAIVMELLLADPFLWPLIMSFILFASVTMMNMLVGVLVEVVGALSSMEKESTMVANVAYQLRSAFGNLDRDTSKEMNKIDFQKLVMEPAVSVIIHDAGVDPLGLLDMADVIFEGIKDSGGLSFEGFLEIILNMRGSNTATVKDVKEQLRLIKMMVQSSMHETQKGILDQVHSEIEILRREISEHLAGGEEFDDIPVSATPSMDVMASINRYNTTPKLTEEG